MGNDVNVVIDNDKIKRLARISRLIRMFGNAPQIASSEVNDDVFKRDIACLFKKFIFLRIPIKLHTCTYASSAHALQSNPIPLL